jgi:predicted AAA+ superfamily ATPase
LTLNLFEDTSIDTVQLAISGPRSSGKTTLLAKAAEVLSRKVQHSNESDGFLVFPLNIRLHYLYLDDPQQFYTATIAILFNAVRYV